MIFRVAHSCKYPTGESNKTLADEIYFSGKAYLGKSVGSFYQ